MNILISLYQMIPIDVVTYIASFIKEHRIGSLNKDIKKETQLNEGCKEWFYKYENLFSVNKIKVCPMNYGDMNWKREYIRVRDYPSWHLFAVENNVCDFESNHYVAEIPKEIKAIINLKIEI